MKDAQGLVPLLEVIEIVLFYCKVFGRSRIVIDCQLPVFN